MNWPAGEEARRQEELRSCTDEDGRIIDLKRLKEIQLASHAQETEISKLQPDAAPTDEIVDRVKAHIDSQTDQRIQAVTEEYERKLSEANERIRVAKSRAAAAEAAIAEIKRQREPSILQTIFKLVLNAAIAVRKRVH